MGASTRIRAGRVVLALGAALTLGPACASTPMAAAVPGWNYFAEPERHDAWSRKIHAWQVRERADRAVEETSDLAPVAGSGVSRSGGGEPGDLRTKYTAFQRERKRATAREVARWIQDQAREHYVADGPVDHWATLEETLRSNGDDCDGLELLTYNFLREAGFRDDEVFRAIVYRPDDGQHHMVTLWFEEAHDPWVIDPTGAMTSGMSHLSEVDGWVPLKVFGEEADFSVRTRATAVAADAQP